MRTLALLALLSAAAPAQRLPQIFVIGDSTAKNGAARGWGDHLGSFFDEQKAVVVNRARAGRSSRTFRTEGLWDAVRNDLQPGDFVLIQFGHNDGGPPDKDRARGSLPGLGDESREFTLPDGKQETVYTFGWYMRHYVEEARAKGATPIVLSPIVRNIWKGIAVERGPGSFMRWSADVARQTSTTFLDVTDAIADTYEDLGSERVAKFFPEDHTHTSPEGAELTASLVVATIRGIPNSPLASLLNAKGLDVPHWPAPIDTARLGIPDPRDPALPTLFLIGDSTVRNGHGDGANNQLGWGEPLVDHFDTARINVVNRAVGGLSSRTYLTQGHWARVLAMLKPGDFVLMQFGHNDSGPLDDAARARGTLPGAGPETKEIDNPITKRHEVVHTYGWYLRRFVEDARAKGATPIVCSLVPRKTWKDGRIVRNSTTYQKWAAGVASSEQAPFIDLNEIVAAKYDALGPAKVDPLFGDEHTHTSRPGAELNADSVVEGLTQIPGLGLMGYLK
jgi:lysophospholipase L1-like esterase